MQLHRDMRAHSEGSIALGWNMSRWRGEAIVPIYSWVADEEHEC